MIQYLVKGENSAVLSKRTVRSFIAGGPITQGDWVMFDTTQVNSDRVIQVVQADTVALGNPLTVGVAITAASSVGDIVAVVTAGYVEGANVASAVTKGQPITTGTVAGRGRLSAAADLVPAQAVALEDASSNTCDIFVFGRID